MHSFCVENCMLFHLKSIAFQSKKHIIFNIPNFLLWQSPYSANMVILFTTIAEQNYCRVLRGAFP